MFDLIKLIEMCVSMFVWECVRVKTCELPIWMGKARHENYIFKLKILVVKSKLLKSILCSNCTLSLSLYVEQYKNRCMEWILNLVKLFCLPFFQFWHIRLRHPVLFSLFSKPKLFYNNGRSVYPYVHNRLHFSLI